MGRARDQGAGHQPAFVIDGNPLSGMLSEIADQTSRHTSEIAERAEAPSLADRDLGV